MKDIIVAIDGYSGCGKSSTAKALAQKFHYSYIDSGAMYRATTHYFLEHNIDHENNEMVAQALKDIQLDFHVDNMTGQCHLFLNGANSEPFLRTMLVNKSVSQVSSIKEVRKYMVDQQRAFGLKRKIVMDGRDIGTVVFPDAELKLFLTADIEIRARRRQKELVEKGRNVTLDEVIANFKERDYLDTHRKESPLRKAEDAIEIDTSNLTFEKQVVDIAKLMEDKINEG